jgi:hypothetical protein
LRGETWWIDGRFSGAKNRPRNLNFSVENLEGHERKADPPSARKDDNKRHDNDQLKHPARISELIMGLELASPTF